MKIAVVIPTRGDRPQLYTQALNMLGKYSFAYIENASYVCNADFNSLFNGAIQKYFKSLYDKGSRAFWKRISYPSLRDGLGLQRLPHFIHFKIYAMQTRKKKDLAKLHPKMGDTAYLLTALKKLELFEVMDEFNMWNSRQLTQHIYAAMKLYAKNNNSSVDNAFETTQKVMALITAVNQCKDEIFSMKHDLDEEIDLLSQW